MRAPEIENMLYREFSHKHLKSSRREIVLCVKYIERTELFRLSF